MRTDIARVAWRGAKVAHCLFPAWEEREFSTNSEPGSIGVAFTGQIAAFVRREGANATERLDIPAGSVGLCGEEPLYWIRVPAASDVVEITAHACLRLEIAESMGVARHAHLDDLHGWFDAAVLAAASRLRAAARGWSGMTDVAGDELVRCLYAHVYRLKFGGRWPSDRPRALSARQLAAVVKIVHERLAGELSIDILAGAVSLSAFHFARSFKAAIGLAPHRFVTIIRLQRAQELLMRTPMSVADVAAAVGYANVNHFRRMFRSQLGELPSALRRAK